MARAPLPDSIAALRHRKAASMMKPADAMKANSPRVYGVVVKKWTVKKPKK